MYRHAEIVDGLNRLIHSGEITISGNEKLRVYGTLRCSSGKRMQTKNRVFFSSQEEAIELGFRPCGNCMKNEYRMWKLSKNRVE